jgi:outer membrane beta-barrel protein
MLLAGPTSGHAEESDTTIRVIQPKPVLRHTRAYLAPRFSTSINDPMLQQFAAGGSLGFNISERFSLGVTFDWLDFDNALGGTTARYERVISQTNAIPEVAPINWFGGLEATFVPLYGKLVLFNKVIGFWDLGVTAAAGVVNGGETTHAGWGVGVVTTAYFTRWLGLTGTVRDIMSIEELPSGNQFTQTVLSSVGVTILMPFNFRYDTAEEEL